MNALAVVTSCRASIPEIAEMSDDEADCPAVEGLPTV